MRGCYNLSKFEISKIKNWISFNFGSYESESWEINWADDSADYFLYSLDSGEVFRIKQKGRRIYIENRII